MTAWDVFWSRLFQTIVCKPSTDSNVGRYFTIETLGM